MAITEEMQTQITELYVGLIGRAPDVDGFSFWVNSLNDKIDRGLSETEAVGAVAQEMFDADATASFYPGSLTNEQIVSRFYENALGREGDQGGIEFWTAALEGDQTTGEVLVSMIDAVKNFDGTDSQALTSKALFNNKVAVSEFYVNEISQSGERDIAGSTALLEDVTADTDTSSDAAIQTFIESTGDQGFTLTQRADTGEDFTGTDEDNKFEAPVTQNETGSGQLANTFETGDVLDGGGGSNTLEAELVASSTIGGSNGGADPTPIAAQTDNIQRVFFTAQQQAGGINNVTVDAGDMNDVEQWWTDNSREDIKIEDIRTTPTETTFGVRETDESEGFTAQFNPLFLEGRTEEESAFNFIVRESDNTANELNDITVSEVSFRLNEESFELAGDDVLAADTFDGLETALQEAIDAEDGLEGVTASHQGNGQFVVNDPNAGTFAIDEALGEGVSTTSTTEEDKAAAVGGLDRTELPTTSTVVLDGAGNGSQGGAVDIGVMSGNRGVEELDVEVDRTSDIQSLSSEEDSSGTNNFLESVTLTNADGADGDVFIGQGNDRSSPRQNGLSDVQELDASAFANDVNVGITLDNFTSDLIESYFEDLGAGETADFSYVTGAGADTVSVEANQTLSQDPDFRLDIATGAADDRINLTGNQADLVTTSLDGGAGDDAVSVASSIGVDEDSTPAAFDNLEALILTNDSSASDVDADLDTQDPDVTLDVDDVVVATGASGTRTAVDSTISNLDNEETSLTVSGRNQTSGPGASNDTQFFGSIDVEDASTETLDVALENTARAGGTLIAQALNVTGADSDVETVNLVSEGERNTQNVVADFSAAAVTTLNLQGTQDLAVFVEDMATAEDDTPLTVNGEDFGAEGDPADLTVHTNAALLTEDADDTLTGSDGDDIVRFFNDMGTDTNPTVEEFETLKFGSSAGAAQGTFDAANTSDVEAIVIDRLNGDLILNSLSGGGTAVTINDGGADENIDLNGPGSGAMDVNLDSGITPGGGLINGTNELVLAGVETVNLDVARPDVFGAGATADLQVALKLDGADLQADLENTSVAVGVGNEDDEAVVDTLNVTGGSSDNPDTLFLGNTNLQAIPASLSTIDFSGYNGDVEFGLADASTTALNPGDPGGGIDHDASTDTNIVLGENNAEISLTDGGDDFSTNGADNVNFNTEIVFTEADSQDGSQWQINNFVADGFDSATANNVSVLNLEGLGVENFTDLIFTEITGGTDTDGDPGEVLTTGNGVEIQDGTGDWTIGLVGVDEGDLAVSENFDFA